MRGIVPRRLTGIVALAVAAVAVAAPSAWAQNPAQGVRPQPAPAGEVQGQNLPAPIDPKKLEVLLNTWEQNSANLKTLDVRMTRTDRSPAWDEDDHYEGRAMFKTPNRAWLDFRKQKEVKDQKTGARTQKFIPHERIVCTGTEVWQYRCDTSQIFIYPLEKDVQQRALEEGPLPFLFNFKVAEAKKRYMMTLVDDAPSGPTIRIIPRLPIDQESFKVTWVILNRQVMLDRQVFLLPRRIFLVLPDGKSSKDFQLQLTPQVANCEVRDENFQPDTRPEATKGWKIVRNPGGDEKPAASRPAPAAAPAPARVGATAPAEQPATTPRTRIFGGRRN
jgi:TIGR03009 family protein